MPIPLTLTNSAILMRILLTLMPIHNTNTTDTNANTIVPILLTLIPILLLHYQI